jgi:hypothetical protein
MMFALRVGFDEVDGVDGAVRREDERSGDQLGHAQIYASDTCGGSTLIHPLNFPSPFAPWTRNADGTA